MKYEKHGHAKNGGSSTYKIWQMMIDRCHHDRSKSFPDYGGRGIAVCERWRESFAAFLHDMGERPVGLSIERIRNDRGYSRSNCKWATRIEQNNNSRQNRIFTFQGETLTAAQWAKRVGISRETILNRVDVQKMPVEQALTLPADMAATRRASSNFATLTFQGETLTYFQWAEKTGLGRGTIQLRIQNGWSVEKTLTTPPRSYGVKPK
jgi:hypothetical protein